MQYFAIIQDGRVIERIDLPDDLTPGVDIFTPEFAAHLVTVPADIEQGWVAGEGGSFGPPADPEPAPAVPLAISDRQFAQQLAILGTITQHEALVWAARGELPETMNIAIEGLPPAERFGARMLLSSATTYERSHPLVPMLGAILSYDAAELDDLWRAAALL